MVSAVCCYSKTARNGWVVSEVGQTDCGRPRFVVVCRYSKTARNGGTLTLKSIRPVVAIAMSNQIEDDEIEQLETAPSVGPSLIRDLLNGELDSWRVVICEVVKDDDDLLVCGESGQVVERVDTDVWTKSALSGTEVKDLSKIADTINSAIASEHGEL